MSLYRFSPIKNKDELLEAIKYTHLKCSELCKFVFGRYLPVAGNIGIFCHYDGEYKFLTELREELTKKSDNWNQKYYRLHEPITIPTLGAVPGAVYTYLYTRRPDPEKPQVGDVDFVLDRKEYDELRHSLLKGKANGGMKILDRPDLDLIELFDSNTDVLSFIGTENMEGNVKIEA